MANVFIASQVHLLVRGEKLRASKAMADRVLSNSMITVHFNTGVEKAYGGEVLDGLELINYKSGKINAKCIYMHASGAANGDASDVVGM